MIHILIIQVALIAFNLINSEIDAVRILGNKTIYHGINFTAYLLWSGGLWWLFEDNLSWYHTVPYGILAFTCRQITFDIPLNWRRGLKWDYVSLANPPKAITDRIEQWIFGRNGKLPVYIYSVIWTLSLALMLWIFYKL